MAEKDGIVQFEVQYLGNTPLKVEVTLLVAQDALALLKLKLEKLQARKIEMACQEKHGSRLSPVSPIYQKVARTLAKQGHDITRGEKILMLISPLGIALRLPDDSYRPRPDGKQQDNASKVELIPAETITFYKILGTINGISTIVVASTGGQNIICHAFSCAEKIRFQIYESIVHTTSGVTKARELQKKMQNYQESLLNKAGTKKTPALTTAPPKQDQITVGVGLTRHGSMSVSKKGRPEKKAGAPQNVAPQPVVTGGAFGSASGHQPMDELDDLDSDMFDNAVMEKINAQLFAEDEANNMDETDATGDINLESFGFDGENSFGGFEEFGDALKSPNHDDDVLEDVFNGFVEEGF